jgi:hypothetical protein
MCRMVLVHTLDHLGHTENKGVTVMINVLMGNRLHLYSYFLSQTVNQVA